MPSDDSTPSTGLVGGAVKQLVSAFAQHASPEQMLELARLASEAREMQTKAELAGEAIEKNHALAAQAMADRARIADQIDKVLARKDRDMASIIDKLTSTDDPALAGALAQALASVVATDEISQLGEAMSQVKADKVDLKF